MRILFLLLFICSGCFGTENNEKARNNEPILEQMPSYESAVEKTKPHIVKIRIKDKNKLQASRCSGIIINPEYGYVMTCAHVLVNYTSKNIIVELSDGNLHAATVIGFDQETDVAVLQIPKQNLPELTFLPTQYILPGSPVISISYDGGLSTRLGDEPTISTGSISAKYMSDFKTSSLAIDAVINPGSSGGAIVNVFGQFLGMSASGILTDLDNPRLTGKSGINRTIPMQEALSIASKIIQHGYVKFYNLGFAHQHLTEDLAKALNIDEYSKAILVNSVTPDSLGDKMGLKELDVITAFNGVPITSKNQIYMIEATAYEGQKSTFTIIRNGKTQTLDVTFSTINEKENKINKYFHGYSFTLFNMYDYKFSTIKGLLIQRINLYENNPVCTLLHEGQVILEINHKPVTSFEDFVDITTNASGPILVRAVDLLTERTFYQVIKPIEG